MPECLWVVGFSATSFKSTESIEMDYLQEIGVKVHDCCLEPTFHTDNLELADSFDHFFQTTVNISKLVFANSRDIASIRMLSQKYNCGDVMVDCRDPELIRNMGHRVFVYHPKHENIFRGTDFHSGANNGIDLLIATTLTTTRMFVQSCGRVGRAGDPCSRYQLKRVPALNPSEDGVLLGKLKKKMAELSTNSSMPKLKAVQVSR